jgi:hypothetical protein
MILTPEEQIEYREEIDYQIETRSYEYVWGRETAMDKTKGLLRDAPGQIIGGLQKIASNPTVISINEKLAAHNAKLCEMEAQVEMNRANVRVDVPSRGNARKRRGAESNPLPEGFEIGNDHL